MGTSEATTEVLLIGGGVASVRCARTLRREGFEGRIVLVGDETTPPYNRPPLSKELLREELPDDLALAEPEAWYARRAIDLRLGVKVAALDAERRTATLEDGSRIAFDKCLIATGAEPRAPRIPGGERARLLRTIADSHVIRADANPGTRAVVVGGGFIGVELASSLAARGVSVTVCELSDSLWGGSLGGELSAWALDRLTSAGITVRTGAAAESIDPDGVRVGTDVLPADLVIAGIGVLPRVALATAAGLDVDDGILTDARHETSASGIFAAGDVARVDGLRVEHWHAAREAGERAALGMLGRPITPQRAPWVFSEVVGVALDVFGLAREWDEERWLRHGSILAYVARGRVVQLAAIGSTLDSRRARELVAQGASVGDLEAALPPE